MRKPYYPHGMLKRGFPLIRRQGRDRGSPLQTSPIPIFMGSASHAGAGVETRGAGPVSRRVEGPCVNSSQHPCRRALKVHDVQLASGGLVQLKGGLAAASRKKTDRRDASWIARTLQTGMTPHPAYIPTGHLQRLRNLLSRREAVAREQRRWLLRARAHLEAAGYKVPRKKRVPKLIEAVMSQQDGMDTNFDEALQRCRRMQDVLLSELKQVEAAISEETDSIDAIGRLKTIPAVGDRVAVMLYAWVGDISRFPDARMARDQ